MEDETRDPLMLDGRPWSGTTRRSTLWLYLRRTYVKWSTRCWVVIAVIVFLLFYHSNRSPASIKLGEWKSSLKYQGRTTTRSEWRRRAAAVKEAFLHAYDAYEREAFPKDELRPLTADGMQMYVSILDLCELTHYFVRLNGWGLTAVDALDTMIIMGLHAQANRTIRHIGTLEFSGRHVRSVFSGSTE